MKIQNIYNRGGGFNDCIVLPQNWAHSQRKTHVLSMSPPLKTVQKELKKTNPIAKCH